jgi:hypothetical protein
MQEERWAIEGLKEEGEENSAGMLAIHSENENLCTAKDSRIVAFWRVRFSAFGRPELVAQNRLRVRNERFRYSH